MILTHVHNYSLGNPLLYLGVHTTTFSHTRSYCASILLHISYTIIQYYNLTDAATLTHYYIFTHCSINVCKKGVKEFHRDQRELD